MSRIEKSDKQWFGESLLDVVVDWIAGNLEPDQVYTEEDLQEWAETHGFVLEADVESYR